MLEKMSEEPPPKTAISGHQKTEITGADIRVKPNPVAWFKNLLRKKPSNGNNFHEAIEEFIEDLGESSELDKTSVDNQKLLISNVLKTHDLRVDDVMVPRPDIVAIEHDVSMDELLNIFKENQFSRIPVYKDNLDNVIGVLHIKDLLMCFLEKRECKIPDIIREVSFVSPGIPIMDLFLMLREDKKHMALVVDEHGGIDGLVTINDIVEAVMGDIDDEFDNDDEPQIIEKSDGSIVMDARYEIDDFEERYGSLLSEEERDDIDTIGGLAFYLAGHIPKKGDVLNHSSGMTIEVIEANKNRVKTVRLRNIPALNTNADDV